MSNWTPTVGEHACLLTPTSYGDSVTSATIKKVTATTICTCVGEFFTERIGRYPDSFRSVNRRRLFGPYGSLIRSDSPEAQAALKVQRARFRVQDIASTGRQLSQVTEITDELDEVLYNAITTLAAIKYGIGQEQPRS